MSQILEEETNAILITAEEVRMAIQTHLDKDIYHDVILCGSIAKGTAVKGTSDVDWFIRFEEKLTEMKIRRHIELLAAKLINRGFGECKLVNGTYTYIRTVYKGIEFNIVPCRYIEDVKYRVGITDITPFHVQFIKTKLSDEQKTDVVKLKVLLKEHGIYGAADNIKGFSGYVCEVLVYKYGSFGNVIFAYANIKDKTRDAMLEIRDPIDSTRFLDAAISMKNFGKFIQICRRHMGLGDIRKPSKDQSELTYLFNDHAIAVNMKTDNIPEIERESKKIKHYLNNAGFKILYMFPYRKQLVILLENKIVIRGFYIRDLGSLTHNAAKDSIPRINTVNSIKIFTTNDLKYKSIECRQLTKVTDVLYKEGYNTVVLGQKNTDYIDAFLKHDDF